LIIHRYIGVQDSLIDVNWGQDTAHDLHLRNPNVKFKKYIGLDHEIGEVQVFFKMY
jgi:hypothetical protein